MNLATFEKLQSTAATINCSSATAASTVSLISTNSYTTVITNNYYSVTHVRRSVPVVTSLPLNYATTQNCRCNFGTAGTEIASSPSFIQSAASSKLMNKNIDITTNQTDDLDSENDIENEEEKEICLMLKRRDSVPEESYTTKLNTIKESAENIISSSSSSSNLLETSSSSTSSTNLKSQTVIIEPIPTPALVSTDTAATCETTLSVTLTTPTEEDKVSEEEKIQNILNTSSESLNKSASSTNLLAEKNLGDTDASSDVIDLPNSSTGITTTTTEATTAITSTTAATVTATAGSSIATAVSATAATATTTATTNPIRSSSPEDSPPRKNSDSSCKLKISKTLSSSKLLSSSQLSLSTTPSGGRPDEDAVSKTSDTSVELRQSITPDTTDKPKGASKLAERAKKKSWYNVLYPNYKSRSQDFKKLFKEVPNDERLIVDYSCALQRDILVQGRLYVSQNYVCFHANIFRWETYLSIKWKDVTSISKEKTALVIPNAISICTAKEKYFFATFTTRDKAFLMLFRVWQNTLMNKQMLPQEMWQWVHNCYGDELGLTTDDEDYIDPSSVLIENDGDDDFVTALDDTSTQILDTIPCENILYISNSNQSVNQIANKKDKNNSDKITSSSNTSSGSGGKSKIKSRYFSSNKTNLNSFTRPSSTSASASGSDNKTSDNNSRQIFNKIITMNSNAKELTFSSAKPDEISIGVGAPSSADGLSSNSATKEIKSNVINENPGKRKVSKNTRQRDESLNKNPETLPTDVSDSSDSDENKIPFVATAECTSTHEGRQLVHTILPINIETLFNLLFSKSKFLVDFHEMRRTTDTNFGNWIINEDGRKTRTVNLTVQLAASVGPKTSRVTEYQTMRDCSVPNELYSIDINSENAGIPYADSFSVLMHYCLVRTVDDHTMLSVHAQIKYKKSIWAVVKGFIEKNTWAGLEDFYTALLHALQSETNIPPAKGKGRRPRRGITAQIRPIEETPLVQSKPELIEHAHGSQIRTIAPHLTNTNNMMKNNSHSSYKWLSVFIIFLFIFLIIVNVILLLKLWKLEERIEYDLAQRARMPNLSALKKLPESHEDWLELFRQQEILHEEELKKWHTVLQTAIELLKKTEKILAELLFQ